MTRTTNLKIFLVCAVLLGFALAPLVLRLDAAVAQASRPDPTATTLALVQQAMAKMETEFGPDVLSDRGPPEVSGIHGRETIGDAWSRTLVSVGLPATMDERESLARKLDLDPRASLVLAAPIANRQAIDYLMKALRNAPSPDPAR